MAKPGAQSAGFDDSRLAAILSDLRAVRPELLAVALATRSGLLLTGSTVAQATPPVQPDDRSTGEVACGTNDSTHAPGLRGRSARRDAETLAALGAGLLASAQTPANALVGGAAEEAVVRGPAGQVIALAAGPNAVLAGLVGPTTSPHLLLPGLRRAAAEIASAIAL